MKLRNMYTVFAVAAIGLSACTSPITGNDNSASASSGNGSVVLGIQASATNTAVPNATVTLFKIEISNANGAPVTVFDNAEGLQISLATLRTDVQQILNVQTVPDGTYTDMAVTLAKDAAATPKVIHMPVTLTVAAGQITTVSVVADPAKLHDIATGHGNPSGAMTADPASMADGTVHMEGNITAIADDKASFSFQPRHSNASVTVNIVSSATNTVDNTQIVGGSYANPVPKIAADLTVGGEVEVTGVLDAATKTLTAKVIKIEQGGHVKNPDAVRVMGAISDVAMDGSSIAVTVDFAKGALPADTTGVTVNIDSNVTKIVKAPNSTLTVGDKVFVMGLDVRDNAGAATNVINAKLIVVRAGNVAGMVNRHMVLSGMVTTVNTSTRTLTMTPATQDINGNAMTDLSVTVRYSKADMRGMQQPLVDEDDDVNDQGIDVEGDVDDEGTLVATKVGTTGATKTITNTATGIAYTVVASHPNVSSGCTGCHDPIPVSLTSGSTSTSGSGSNAGGNASSGTRTLSYNGKTYTVVANHPNVTSGCTGCHNPIPQSLTSATGAGTTTGSGSGTGATSSGGTSSAATKTLTYNGTTYTVVATHPNATSGCTGCHDPIPASLNSAGTGTTTSGSAGATPTPTAAPARATVRFGEILGVDDVAKTFQLVVRTSIAGQQLAAKVTVDYSAARLKGFKGAAIAAGQRIVVSGTLDAASNTLKANVVALIASTTTTGNTTGGNTTGGNTTGGNTTGGNTTGGTTTGGTTAGGTTTGGTTTGGTTTGGTTTGGNTTGGTTTGGTTTGGTTTGGTPATATKIITDASTGLTYKVVATHPAVTSGCAGGCHQSIPTPLP